MHLATIHPALFCFAMSGFLLAVALGLVLGWLISRPRRSNPPPANSSFTRLYRSRDLRMIAGVCGGLGKYFNMDPIIVRVLWVIFALASLGIALIVYVIMAIVVPEEPPVQL
jgi:phage shock protein C